jgi:hypothetical protein
MIIYMAPQTAISKAVCYKTKNEQLWEKAVHFLLVATNCFYAGLPTVFCTITLLYMAEGYHFMSFEHFEDRAGLLDHDIVLSVVSW